MKMDLNGQSKKRLALLVRMNGLSIFGQGNINLNICCMLGKVLLYLLICFLKVLGIKGNIDSLYFIKYLNHDIL